ncbi:MAG TPA: AtpZ/AtpI family protein [Pseudomonadales bacterium]|nr:AtpZ/AtpI family protein [Pseudomonadales bacterium]
MAEPRDRRQGREPGDDQAPAPLVDAVGQRAARKLHARRQHAPGIWSGLGMMGLVGWSVAVPTLLGAALGLWLDARGSGERSWTLALLVAGLVLGCANAWRWVSRERAAIHREEEDGDDDDER